MDPYVAGALIQGGSDLFGSLVNNIWSQANQAGSREHQYQMTDYLYSLDLQQWQRQNDYNLQMWNMQNQYNSPASQMARFKEAGLNPNLIYGQGQPGLASPVPQANGPQAKGQAINTFKPDIQIPQVLPMIMDAVRTKQQLANMEQMRLKTVEDTNLARAKALIEMKKANFTDQEIQMTIERFGWDKQQFEQNKSLWPSQLEASKLMPGKLGAEIAKDTESANFIIEQKNQLKREREFWEQNGIDLRKAPFWLQWIFNAYNGFINNAPGIFLE